MKLARSITRNLRWILLALLILVLIAPFFLLAWFLANRWSHDDLIVSKETTYITEPLDELGYPDYAAALNERMSKGVTPENNAAVLLLQAVGPKDIPAEKREEFFKALGIAELPETGDYLIGESEYAQTLSPAELPALPEGTSVVEYFF